MDRRAEGWAERVVEGEKAAAPGRRSVTLPGSGEEESTGPSSGTSSSSSLSVRPTRRLLRVMVVDYPTGIALFHHTWAWKGDPNVPGIAKVIVALYKLSQSLGGRGGTFTPSFILGGGCSRSSWRALILFIFSLFHAHHTRHKLCAVRSSAGRQTPIAAGPLFHQIQTRLRRSRPASTNPSPHSNHSCSLLSLLSL